MFWILHNKIIEDRKEEILDYLNKYNRNYVIIEDKEIPNIADYNDICSLTTVQCMKKIKKNNSSIMWTPERFTISAIDKHYRQFLLSEPVAWFPMGNMKFTKFPIFVRPNNSDKIFTGQTLYTTKDWDFIYKTYGSDNTLVAMSEFKKLDDIEWRFWIKEKQIVSYSPYSWNNDLNLDIDLPNNIKNFVDNFCKTITWEPDIMFVADFGVCDNQVGLIEVNSVNSSGLYNYSNIENIFTAMEDSVKEINHGDYTLYD